MNDGGYGVLGNCAMHKYLKTNPKASEIREQLEKEDKEKYYEFLEFEKDIR